MTLVPGPGFYGAGPGQCFKALATLVAARLSATVGSPFPSLLVSRSEVAVLEEDTSSIASHGWKEHVSRSQSVAASNDQISFRIVSSQPISANVPSAVISRLAQRFMVERMKREWNITCVPGSDLRFKL